MVLVFIEVKTGELENLSKCFFVCSGKIQVIQVNKLEFAHSFKNSLDRAYQFLAEPTLLLNDLSINSNGWIISDILWIRSENSIYRYAQQD